MSALITLSIIIILLILLALERVDALKLFIIVSALFLLLGYITLDELVEGFSNKGILAVAVLYIIAGALEQSPLFKRITRFDGLKKEKFNPLGLFSLVTTISAFINNTPVVSIFIPIVKRIASKTNRPASHYLIPISYLAMLGGTLTLIGTSTNLVVSGLLESYGQAPIGFFELSLLGVPVAIVGLLYILFAHKKMLPTIKEDFTEQSKVNEHLVRFSVGSKSELIGKSVQQAKLRALSGVYLFGIEREDCWICPVTPEQIINEKDLLVFAGQIDKIDELKKIQGLFLEAEGSKNSLFIHENTVMMEVILTQLLDHPTMVIKELNFRERFNAVVIGIMRNGERLQCKLGSVSLRLGDTLLLIVDKNHQNELQQNSAFTVIRSDERVIKTSGSYKDMIPLMTIIGVIVGSIVFDLNILTTATYGVAFLLMTNTVTIPQALKMIDFKTLLLIALSFAVGLAIGNTGSADLIASWMGVSLSTMPPLVLLSLAFVLTMIVTNIITNNAAAVLMVPVVWAMALKANLDPRPFILVTTIAASSAYLSPYGYQTNTMVYGAGGYKFGDFFRFGWPLSLMVMMVTVLCAYVYYF
jgi:di/tricarboxylate transporter